MATIIPLLIVTALAGCNNPETWRWREEVALSDGKVIVVERNALRNNVWPNMGNGGYRSVVDQKMSFTPLPPGGVGALWNQKDHSDMSPFVLDRSGDKVYIAGTPRGDMADHCLLFPTQNSVVILALTRAGWAQVPQSDALLDTLHANLLWDVSWGEPIASEKPKELSLDAKSSRAKYDFRAPMTLREFLKQNRYTCADVLDRAGYRREAAEARKNANK